MAWLTLCAITASSPSARAQSAPTPDLITSLLDSATGDEATPQGPLASLASPRLQVASAAAPAEQGSTAAAAQADADDGSGLRTAGYVAGGVGLVGIALFAIAGLGAKSAYDKLDSDCGNAPCTDEAHRSDIEGGRMLQTTANIGLALGLTGLGVGATLLVLGSRSSAERRGPSASVSANGGMITYGGYF